MEESTMTEGTCKLVVYIWYWNPRGIGREKNKSDHCNINFIKQKFSENLLYFPKYEKICIWIFRFKHNSTNKIKTIKFWWVHLTKTPKRGFRESLGYYAQTLLPCARYSQNKALQQEAQEIILINRHSYNRETSADLKVPLLNFLCANFVVTSILKEHITLFSTFFLHTDELFHIPRPAV